MECYAASRLLERALGRDLSAPVAQIEARETPFDLKEKRLQISLATETRPSWEVSWPAGAQQFQPAAKCCFE